MVQWHICTSKKLPTKCMIVMELEYTLFTTINGFTTTLGYVQIIEDAHLSG